MKAALSTLKTTFNQTDISGKIIIGIISILATVLTSVAVVSLLVSLGIINLA
jgi:hypothetical protein